MKSEICVYVSGPITLGDQLSCEPLLGPVDVASSLALAANSQNASRRTGLRFIDWVIVGGESGPGARPMDLEWARSIVKQCGEAGVPCFVKQLGSVPVGSWGETNHPAMVSDSGRWLLRDSKGGDMSEWPEDLRVREFPK